MHQPTSVPSVPNWQAEKIYEIYESGKGRRYKLLFTVNGGAYVLIGFLVDKADALKSTLIGIWAFVLIPLALMVYTRLMYKDIHAFGTRMRNIYTNYVAACAQEYVVYKAGGDGEKHLKYVYRLLIASWLAAIVLIILQWSHLLSLKFSPGA